MCQWWNTEYHGLFPVKLHPVEKKLYYIMMKLDNKHSNHWIYKFGNTGLRFFFQKKTITFSSLLQTSWKCIFVEHSKIL